MLTEEEKNRLRLEEIFRAEVREELDRHKFESPRKRLWSFLNTSFAIWFLSAIVLSGVTGVYAYFQGKRDETSRKSEIVRRLDTEIGNRIFHAITGGSIDKQRIEQGKLYSPNSIYGNTLWFLNNYFIAEDNPNDFSVYPEFQKRNFRSLIFELSTLVEPEVLLELRDVNKAYQELVESSSFPTNNYTKDDSLAAVEKSLHMLTSRILKPRWQLRL